MSFTKGRISGEPEFDSLGGTISCPDFTYLAAELWTTRAPSPKKQRVKNQNVRIKYSLVVVSSNLEMPRCGLVLLTQIDFEN
jgi:hypothetical protein